MSLIRTKNERNKMLRNNILGSGALKSIGLLTSLLIVPVTINYLDNEVYGIWMTISSMLFWIGIFDIGLGNGMRNYLTESISNGDYKRSRKYISTTFSLLSIVAIVIFLMALIPMSLMNFNWLFNTTHIDNTTLRDALFVAISFTLLNFVLKNIGLVFVALQKYALNDLLNVLGNVISLLIIYLLTKFTTGNLLYVVLVYTGTYTCIYLFAIFPTFRHYPQLKPSLADFDRSIGKQVISKGLGFFIIQITSCLFIFGAANVFITRFCGPSQVTVYNIAYKYFNLLVIAYTVLISPMWNAYTDAYVKKDWIWIEKNFKRSLRFWLLSVMGGLIMLLLGNSFYYLWVGNKVVVPLSVSMSVLAYVCFFNLNNCATYLINGLNKIRIQIITSVSFTVIYFVAVVFVGKQHGIEGIVIAMAASYALMAIIHLYQCHLLIQNKAQGIWNH
ncbi:lipopolysaccharide biosynthesis protein [Hallella colorans]|uniref:lipopolysaccharide biosynthesis protein n=1 Tax=Hallella colorans TaxID=1703337 RepID=UPI0023F22B63|nr:MATE family efflux transporter [Hallella colorans]